MSFTQRTPLTSPLSFKRISFVEASQRRSQPSSWEVEVRSFLGQAGQQDLSSFSGGMGLRSSCQILPAP